VILTIILNIITEVIQFYFIKYSTPDVSDILFGITGSVLSFLIITNLRSSDIETQKSF
jgi:glycopeptide antibiotics resistance protein